MYTDVARSILVVTITSLGETRKGLGTMLFNTEIKEFKLKWTQCATKLSKLVNDCSPMDP